MGEHAGMWLRVSKQHQEEANQVPDNERWIESHSYDLKRTYTIHGKSAFKGNKQFDQAWAQCLSDIRDGIIKVLVTWKQDRIDRKLQTFQMLEQVVAAGGRVEFVTQPHLNDLTTMGGRISLKVQEEIAYAESKDKSDRILAKHATLRDRGSLIGKPNFGYSVCVTDGLKTLVPNELGLKYIPEIFTRCINGDSTATIARWLTEQGVHTSSGKPWRDHVVGKIIRNRVYMGYRTDSAGHAVRCDKIVDADVWARANAAYDSRPKRGPANASDRAMLAVVLTCPGCGSPMYRCHSGRSGQRVPYYRCNGQGPQRKGCGNMVRCDLADQKVDRVISSVYGQIPEMVRVLVPGSNHSTDLADVAYQLQQLPMRGLSRDDQRAEQERLWALEDELSAMKATPDTWADSPTGKTLGGIWEGLSTPQRGAWLKERGFTIGATRDAVTFKLTFASGHAIQWREDL